MRRVIIHLVAGARPNFMKIAPVYHLLKNEPWARVRVIHTGQHYDESMSGAFLKELNLPEEIVFLNVGSADRDQQIKMVRQRYKEECLKDKPDCVVVVGDVNSTLACALAAKDLGILLAHLEAGLRSRDLTMAEEINRIQTDALSDILWTPSPDADENLFKEGIGKERIERVGNIMIDSYAMLKERMSEFEQEKNEEFFAPGHGDYGVVTLHRPVNVDNKETLARLLAMLSLVSQEIQLVFPAHPRTAKMIRSYGLESKLKGARVRWLGPLQYTKFLALVRNAKLVITDSGGIQEETTYLGIPCLTLRRSTERPITVIQGTNELVSEEDLLDNVRKVLSGKWKRGSIPEYWDGNTAARVVKSLKKFMKVQER